VTNFLGIFPGNAPAIAEAASPLAYVSAGDAPFLFVHGTRDELVPVSHSRWMAAALREAGVPATVVEVRGMGHGYVSLAGGGRPRVGCTVLAFLDRWLKKGGSRL
jgi:dipeptidyl aminopeptidase/acylaminoacyl peptidase